jgi:polar amino acid transport system substrate-binding protein
MRAPVPLIAASLLAGMLAIAGPARAQNDVAIPTQTAQPELVKMLPPATAESKSFTLAVALGSPPDDFRNAQGEISGWEIDLLRAATEAMGLKLDMRPTTFDTLIPSLQAKRFDGAVGQIGITDAREKILDMVGTLIANEEFAALADSKIEVKSLDDICGLSVGTTRGSREIVFADQEQPKCSALGKPPVNALAFNDGNGAVEALMSRRVDLFWLGSTAVSYFVAQSKGRTKVVGSYTDRSYLGVALPKGSDLAKPLQAALQYLIEDGTYAKVIQKWGLEDGAIKTVPLNPTGTPQ